MGVTNFVGEAWRAGRSFVTGLSITFQEMVFRPPITVFYPDVKDDVPAWFRGIPVQKTDLLTGEYKCTSCNQCVDACPIDVINLQWHQNPETKKKEVDRYAIDFSRCMQCGLCAEACPFDSLVMGMDYELSKVNPENLVFEFDSLLKMGLKYSSASDPTAKPKRGGPPHWLFAGLTNATEEDIQDVNGFLGRAPVGKGYEPDLKPQFRKPVEPEAPAAPAAPEAPAAAPAAPAAPAAEAPKATETETKTEEAK